MTKLATPLLLAGVFIVLSAPVQGAAQATSSDSLRILSEAREAQARFERIHRRHLPLSLGTGGGCDEQMGRFCFRHTVGYRWLPPPEAEAIVSARAELLAKLEEGGRELPGDGWIHGQRVRYLADAGRWQDALALTGGDCDARHRDLCLRLRGMVLHLLGRYGEAEEAFRRSIPPDSLLDPGPLLDLDGRAALEGADRERRRRLLDLYWWLADPLRLVPGNDRRSAHAARLTDAYLRGDARTPWRVPWGDDLTELVVRYGVESGWQRAPPRPLQGADLGVTGHHDPDGRRWVPTTELLLDPWEAEPSAFEPVTERTRSVYAPSYARDFRSGTGWVAVLREGDSLTVVGVIEHGPLPADTPRVGGDPSGRPLRLPPDSLFPWAGEEERVGLYLRAEDGTETGTTSDEGAVAASSAIAAPSAASDPSPRPAASLSAAVLVRVPAGRHLVSLERWDPGAGRASRIRRGIDERIRPPDLPTLSDLLLLEPETEGEGEGASPTDLLPRLRADLRLRPGEVVGLAWQVWGLGWGGEAPLTYRLTLEPTEEGLLRRAGAWLGLVDRARPLALEWSEPGPPRPGPLLRSVDLTVPGVEPGRYRLVVRVDLPGRSPLVSTLPVEVVEGPGRR